MAKQNVEGIVEWPILLTATSPEVRKISDDRYKFATINAATLYEHYLQVMSGQAWRKLAVNTDDVCLKYAFEDGNNFSNTENVFRIFYYKLYY